MIRLISRISLVLLLLTSITACQSLKNEGVKQTDSLSDAEQSVSEAQDNNSLLNKLSVESGLQFAQSNELQCQKALENNFTHQSSQWIDELNKAKLSITPTRTYELTNKVYCRDYNVALTQGTTQITSSGSACRQQGGVWLAQ